MRQCIVVVLKLSVHCAHCDCIVVEHCGECIEIRIRILCVTMLHFDSAIVFSHYIVSIRGLHCCVHCVYCDCALLHCDCALISIRDCIVVTLFSIRTDHCLQHCCN